MEVISAARQNDYATGWTCMKFIGVKLIAQLDVKHLGHHCVSSILRVLVRHQLHVVLHSDPDRVWESLRGLANKYGQPDRRWGTPRKASIFWNVFGKDRSESVLTELVSKSSTAFCFDGACVSLFWHTTTPIRTSSQQNRCQQAIGR